MSLFVYSNMLLNLDSDSVGVVASHCDYLGWLSLASLNHALRFHQPKKLSTDKLILEVISSASPSLYSYYTNEGLMPVWNLILNQTATLAHLGKTLSSQAIKQLLSTLDLTSQQICVILEFVIVSRPLDEVLALCTHHITEMVCGCRGVVRDYLIFTCDGVSSDLRRHLMIGNEDDYSHYFSALYWGYRHGYIDPKIDPRTLNSVSGLDRAFSYGHSDFYLSILSMIPASVINREINRELQFQLRCAFIEGQTTVVANLRGRGVQFDDHWLLWTNINLSTAMVELVSGISTERMELDLTQFWSADQRNAAEKLFVAGCRLCQSLADSLYGPSISQIYKICVVKYMTSTGILEDLLTECISAFAVRLPGIRDFLARTVTTQERLKMIKERLTELALALQTSETPPVHDLKRLIAMTAKVSGLRGCLREIIEPDCPYIGDDIRSALVASGFLSAS